jgi:uncharacterized membrane protein
MDDGLDESMRSIIFGAWMGVILFVSYTVFLLILIARPSIGQSLSSFSWMNLLFDFADCFEST